MSAIITQFPSRIVNSNNTTVSKYNALHFPIIYLLQREDYQIVSVKVISSVIHWTWVKKVMVSMLPVSNPDSINVGDQIYLRSGQYDSICTVTQVLNTSQFYVDAVANGSSSGGFINLNTVRSNYFIQTDILKVVANTYTLVGTIKNRADNRGVVRIDVQPFVKGLEGYDNTFAYNQINKADHNSSGIFNIRYQEGWSTNTIANLYSAVVTPSTMMYFINGAKQLLDLYGQNFGEYVPFVSGVPLAKFLNSINKNYDEGTPTMFAGFPFDVQFVYSDAIAGYTVKRAVDWYDASNQGTGLLPTALILSERYFVNRLMIPAIPAAAKYIKVYLLLDNAAPQNNLYVNPAYFVSNVQAVHAIGIPNPQPPNP